MATKGDENIAVGAVVQGQDAEKIPEGVMKPKDRTHAALDTINVASAKPVNFAEGCKVDESETKIPEEILKPTASGNPTSSADIAAGELVDTSGDKSAEHDAKIPQGIMKPGSVSEAFLKVWAGSYGVNI